MVKVSVIIPVFNVENFIEKTLTSICNQTFSNIEIIVINDGSKDNSGAICDRLAETDSRIHVLHQSNQGVTKTRNIGIRLAKGDYLCFLDSDDWLSKNFINKLVDVCERENADIAFTNHSILNNKKFTYRDDYHQLVYTDPIEKNKLLCKIFFPSGGGKIYRRSTVTKADITFLEQSGYNGFAEDLLFNFEAINTAKKLVFVPDEYYFYNRDNPNSVCSLPSRQGENNDGRLTVLTKIFSEAQKLPYRHEISSTLQEISAQHIQWGEKDMARKFIKSPIAGLTDDEREFLLQIAYGVVGKHKIDYTTRLIPSVENNTISKKLSPIPKRIFYVWFGDDIPPDVYACIQTWKLAMPDYEIIQIGEEKSKWFDFQEALKKHNWLKAVYERRLWAYVSDYVRIKVLHDHGGIYFDTDVTVTRSFDPLRKHALFMGFQSPEEVNGAVIGSVKHHKFLRSMLTYYEDNHIFNNPRYLLPEIITHILQDKHGLVPFDSRLTPKITELGDIAIYPEEAFYPFRYQEKYTDSCLSSNTYSVHWWKASWHSEDDLRWLQIGRLGYFNKESETIVENITEVRAEPETIIKNITKITAEQKPIKASRLSWLYRVKKRTHGTKYYILGLPVIVVRKPRHREYVYLLNSIPLFGKKQ